MKRRTKKSTPSYQYLEPRQLLSANGGSTFFLDSATETLYISAAETNSGGNFANSMTVSVVGNELRIAEANCPNQSFPLAGLNRISYRGTFSNDRFINNTDIDTRVTVFAGDDVVESGDGDDRVIGGNGDDTIRSGDGDDYVAGGQGADNISETITETGNDRFFGGPGIDTIISSLGDDFLVGGEEGDVISSGAGNDFVLSGDGADDVNLGGGNDIAYAGSGNDTVLGGGGIDRILGQDGNDEIRGQSGNDSLDGGDGNDNMFGGSGNDRMIGGMGDDDLRGESGRDRITSAVPTTLNETFGIDFVDAGDDTDQDIVLFHPSDNGVERDGDIYNNVFEIRARQNADFLIGNRNQPGWSETASGLQFRHVVQGNGATPGPTDRVRVNYAGTYIDGTPFDANDNITFGLNQVIAGWTEGLQLMNVGGTIELAIPHELAYGPNGRGNIPGFSTLLFTIDLLDIE